ncbi:MAG: flippase-like domain-containing protein [Anaerolineales bacterium]|nr:flippase-like domain-containing protein [Anaerolineales bacterium]
MAPARARRTGTIGVLIGVAVSVVALVAVLRWAGWGPVVVALQQMEPGYLGLAAAVFLLSMLARAVSWWLLLTRSVSLGRTLATLNEGYLLNNLLPWRLGELGRAVLLGRQPGMSTLRVLSTIVIERTYDVILGTTLLVAMLPVVLRLGWASRAALIWGGAVGLALLVLWLLVHHASRIEGWIGRKFPKPALWQARWRRVHSGLAALESPSLFLGSFGAMAVSWILAGVDYWLVLRAFHPSPGWPWAYFMLTATALGGAVPAAPGSIGVFEAAAVAALGAFAVSAGTALAAALVLHAMVYAITVSIGAVALIRDGDTLQGLYQDVVGWLSRREQVEAP